MRPGVPQLFLQGRHPSTIPLLPTADQCNQGQSNGARSQPCPKALGVVAVPRGQALCLVPSLFLQTGTSLACGSSCVLRDLKQLLVCSLSLQNYCITMLQEMLSFYLGLKRDSIKQQQKNVNLNEMLLY